MYFSRRRSIWINCRSASLLWLSSVVMLIYCSIFFFFFAFQGCACGRGQFPGWGLNQSCSLRFIPQPQQHQIQAASAAYTTAHGNAGSLTHWAGPEIKPASSWVLVRFATTEAQWELWYITLYGGPNLSNKHYTLQEHSASRKSFR